MTRGYFQGCPNTTGGWSVHGMRQVAAASGKTAPISGGHLVGQDMEGSVQGLTSCLQRSELLYRGQTMSRFCSSAQRATQRSSLDEIAASQ